MTEKRHSSIDDFTVVKQLGKGAFAGVWLVQRKQDGKKYALKRVVCNGMSRRELEDCLSEVRFLASIRHPNVVQYMDSFVNPGNELCVVMEFASGGDVAHRIADASAKNSAIPEEEIWRLWIQMVEAVAHLHKLKILHRDLKPANVFLGADGAVKVGDLNVSRLVKAGLVKTQIGTPLYMSPEVWASKSYDGGCDVWSLGCLLYELAMLKPPFSARDLSELSRRVQAGQYPPLAAERGYSKDLHNVVASCLQVNSAKRPTAMEILALPPVAKWKERLSAVLRPTLLAEQNPQASPSHGLLSTIVLPQQGLRGLRDALPSPQFDASERVAAVNYGFGAGGAPRSVAVPVRPLAPTPAAVASANAGKVSAIVPGPIRLSAALPASSVSPAPSGGTPLKVAVAAGWGPGGLGAQAQPALGRVVVHGSGASHVRPLMVAGPLGPIGWSRLVAGSPVAVGVSASPMGAAGIGIGGAGASPPPKQVRLLGGLGGPGALMARGAAAQQQRGGGGRS